MSQLQLFPNGRRRIFRAVVDQQTLRCVLFAMGFPDAAHLKGDADTLHEITLSIDADCRVVTPGFLPTKGATNGS